MKRSQDQTAQVSKRMAGGDQQPEVVYQGDEDEMQVELVSEPAGLPNAMIDKLFTYFVRTVTVLAEEPNEVLISEPLSIASDSVNSFANDCQTRIFVINRHVQNDNAFEEPSFYYTINEVHYGKDQILAIVFIKKESAIVADRPFCEQLDVHLVSGKDSYETICAQLLTYFDRDISTPASRLDAYPIQNCKQFDSEMNPMDVAAKLKLKETAKAKSKVLFTPTADEKEKMKIHTVHIGEFEFNEEIYQKLTIDVKTYPNKVTKGRTYSTLYVCPFAPICLHSTHQLPGFETHVRAHFDAFKFRCIYCRHPTVYKRNMKIHIARCMPLLSDKKVDIAVGLSEIDLKVSDWVKLMSNQCWETKHEFSETELNLNALNIKLLKKQFPSFCLPFANELVFNMRFPPNFNAEFDELIREITMVDDEHKNPSKAYVVFELTNGVPTVDELPLCGRYSGSETDSAQNNAQFMQALKNEHKVEGDTYLNRIGKLVQDGRSFAKVTLVSGIINDYQVYDEDEKKKVWYRPRFSVEGAVMRCLRVLSSECWNKQPIYRNGYCPTSDWTGDKLILFGMYTIRRFSPEIICALKNNK